MEPGVKELAFFNLLYVIFQTVKTPPQDVIFKIQLPQQD